MYTASSCAYITFVDQLTMEYIKPLANSPAPTFSVRSYSIGIRHSIKCTRKRAWEVRNFICEDFPTSRELVVDLSARYSFRLLDIQIAGIIFTLSCYKYKFHAK